MRIFTKIRHAYYNIKNGLHNLWRWLPVIWKDRSYDGVFLLIIMRHKLDMMVRDFRTTGMPYEGIENDIQNMLECISHLDALIEEDVDDFVDQKLEEKWGEADISVGEDGVIEVERPGIETEEDEKECWENRKQLTEEAMEEESRRAEKAMQIIAENFRKWWL